jgi:hypothetical protein
MSEEENTLCETEDRDGACDGAASRRIIAYEIDGPSDIRLTAAPVGRAWMDESPQRFAYRCLPLAIANQAGWLLHNPATFTAIWDGGPHRFNVHVHFEDPAAARPSQPCVFTVNTFTAVPLRDNRISSHFGAGTVTFSIPYLFRTPPGINLWVKGPSNWVKDGTQALEGIVETDWTPATFTMNWKLTRPGYLVRFEKGEPFCMLVPVPRGLAESLTPARLPLQREPELEQEYRAWLRSRQGFLQALDRKEPEAVQRGWQRDYVHGVAPSGARAPEHQTRLNLKEFAREEEPEEARSGKAPPNPMRPIAGAGRVG